MFGQGSWGVAGSGSDRHVMVRQFRCGIVGLGQARQVGVWCVMAVMVSRGRCGTFRYGLLWQFWFVRFRSVAVCSGVVRQLGCVTVWFVGARSGDVGQGSYGKLSQGTLRCGEVRSGRHINLRKYRKETK